MNCLNRREMEAYCGDLTQLFGIRECILQGGKAKGTKAYHIHNGAGLEMMVLPDKFFTIAELRIDNINAGFISKSGICAPEFFQEDGSRGFLRTFEAGFLTTCGLTYMGTPGVEDGQNNGLHGVLSNTPAEEPYYRIVWDDQIPWIEFGGKAREAHLFGPNLTITRKVRVSTFENRIRIYDLVENNDFAKAPLMLLYHFNLGYPMLDESCRFYSDMNELEVRDTDSEKGLVKAGIFEVPKAGYQEEVFFRRTDPTATRAFAAVHNQNLQKAVVFCFDPRQLPVLNQWRNPRAGDYGLGIEPGTSHVGGRIRARQEEALMYIEPGEKKEFELEIEFIDCLSENEKLQVFINKTK